MTYMFVSAKISDGVNVQRRQRVGFFKFICGFVVIFKSFMCDLTTTCLYNTSTSTQRAEGVDCDLISVCCPI